MAEVQYVSKDQFDEYKKLVDDRFGFLQGEIRRLRENGRAYPNRLMMCFFVSTIVAIAVWVVINAM